MPANAGPQQSALEGEKDGPPRQHAGDGPQEDEHTWLQDISDVILLAHHLLLPFSPAVDVAELLQQPFALRMARVLVRTGVSLTFS